MVHQVTRFSDAYSAWENWNLTNFDAKSECLLAFKQALQSEQPTLAAVIDYHYQHSASLLSQTHEMPGPTGETNELYTVGRGVALIIQDHMSKPVQKAAIAQLSAALIAGNSVILCSDDIDFITALESAAKSASLPINLLQFASLDAYHQLLESDVRSVGYIGNQEVERNVNRQLAKRTGAIVGLVSETDVETIPVAHDPYLSLRFITERTRTINITAVGGNATLLELGSEAH
ncbi:1-pyrroline-5-carboxylate dehydrogenase [Vibrio pectenicida]|uniref:1-pyrroline-5-carboxylate dehydrogenase n=1 Tax=Vibrio pectenicida TaxID=62763 RepID=A0A427U017_9VIBR|nr:1-pyrroline-5-carboxylate dehydrogenase [Vibrio pectenicida]NOH71920.1 1-pyrroline-5-carboxylate dehydrogenase [Vibrio pectenicida]RSD30042.1 1-pyrroline-5-carboxylate dehydrogenase [Vibrio pectenicida]